MMDNCILFGNGLNYLSDNHVGWDELLKKIKGIDNFDNIFLPNTMIYERALLSRCHFESDKSRKNVRDIESNLKSEISNLLMKQKGNSIYNELSNLNIDNYITTNYDYAFEDSLDLSDKVGTFHYDNEKIYSIRRHKEFSASARKITLWHMHGELNNIKSIQLGLDHYCGGLSKIDSYIKGSYIIDKIHQTKVSSISDKLSGIKPRDNESWIEHFFFSNLHIIGFSLDYSEVDIWWLLNKRARMILDNEDIKNEIIFYVATDTNPENKSNERWNEKKGILKNFRISIEEIPLNNKGYDGFYKTAIDIIRRKSIKKS
ncbi:SIR2 family protein [Enterobacter mori]|uniref:SIR2 family protein n=1 Tax=Enterobacter mori TaxID=539813 RepID=UPI001BA5A421|nr:SIR2 family protein [Enterobacter mori]MBS0862908.1 SIR2 family protein [Enterobacter mori]